MFDWIKDNNAILWWVTAFSAFTFLISLFLLPYLAIRIPADYFTRDVRPVSRSTTLYPVWRVILTILKNGFAGLLIIVGIAMLILPGNGILAIAIGLLMMDLPGKYKIERWIVTRKPVRMSINWVRKKAGHTPLDIPDDLMRRPKPCVASATPIRGSSRTSISTGK